MEENALERRRKQNRVAQRTYREPKQFSVLGVISVLNLRQARALSNALKTSSAKSNQLPPVIYRTQSSAAYR